MKLEKCPICKSEKLPENKQPQSSLHVFSTVYNCGCSINQIFSSDEWDYEQRCDKPKIKSINDVINESLYPDELNIVYSDMKLPCLSTKGIFLAGPTPRDSNTVSWRINAIKHLKEKGFKGYVYVPEREKGWSDTFAYSEQIEWEEEALKKATAILFWIPRNLDNMPAFTTNIEWGYWTAKNPSKLVLGSPTDAPKMDYMRYYADKLDIPNCNTLEKTLELAILKTYT
jgi:hypothetical protein